MGGAHAIYNVFDPGAYQAQQAKLDKIEMDRRLSFEEISDNSTKGKKTKEQTKAPVVNNQQNGLFSSWFGGPPSA